MTFTFQKTKRKSHFNYKVKVRATVLTADIENENGKYIDHFILIISSWIIIIDYFYNTLFPKQCYVSNTVYGLIYKP